MTGTITDRESSYLSSVQTVTGTVALPHGYTLLIWGTSMITVDSHGPPGVPAIFGMLVSACTAYIMVGGLGSLGRRGFDAPPTRRPYAVATANIVTLSAVTGSCALVAALVPFAPAAWLVVGFTGTAVYLAGVALQVRLSAHAFSRQYR